jgi:hypothetical protein
MRQQPIAMKRLLPLAALLALTACGTVGPARRLLTPPHYDSFDWSAAQGANSLRGSVAYATKASGHFTCADGSVALTPAAPASAQRTDQLYGSTEHAIASVETVRSRSAGMEEPAYARYVRATKCDEHGRFSFSGLPDGEWFLIVRAKPARGHGDDVVIMQRVQTQDASNQVLLLR